MRNRRVSVAFCSFICALFFTVLLTPCLLESDLFANLRIQVSFMCMLIWLIAKVIETGRKRYIISCCALSVIAILERPSFLFLLPALGVFFLVCGLYKKNKTVLRFGLGGVAVCTLLILAYCKRNESLSGHYRGSNTKGSAS